jgi:hypothetical protein
VALGRVAGRTAPARRRAAASVSAARRTAGRRPGGRGSAGRGPFAVLVVLILAGGLIALLVLNTALNQGSFTLTRLQTRTSQLTDERQGLQQQIGAWSAPDALSARARQLGMVPGGNPAFLRDDGTVQGSPTPIAAAAVPPVAQPTASPSAGPSAGASAHPSAGPSGTAKATATAKAGASAGASADAAKPGLKPAAKASSTPTSSTPTSSTPTGTAH